MHTVRPPFLYEAAQGPHARAVRGPRPAPAPAGAAVGEAPLGPAALRQASLGLPPRCGPALSTRGGLPIAPLDNTHAGPFWYCRVECTSQTRRPAFSTRSVKGHCGKARPGEGEEGWGRGRSVKGHCGKARPGQGEEGWGRGRGFLQIPSDRPSARPTGRPPVHFPLSTFHFPLSTLCPPSAPPR